MAEEDPVRKEKWEKMRVARPVGNREPIEAKAKSAPPARTEMRVNSSVGSNWTAASPAPVKLMAAQRAPAVITRRQRPSRLAVAPKRRYSPPPATESSAICGNPASSCRPRTRLPAPTTDATALRVARLERSSAWLPELFGCVTMSAAKSLP